MEGLPGEELAGKTRANSAGVCVRVARVECALTNLSVEVL